MRIKNSSIMDKMNAMENRQDKLAGEFARLDMSIANLQAQINTLNLQLQANRQLQDTDCTDLVHVIDRVKKIENELKLNGYFDGE